MQNIRDNGADPTGVADCTQIIRQAIWTGEGVYIPAGKYRVKGAGVWGANVFEILKPQMIVGDGASSQLIIDNCIPAGLDLFHVAPDMTAGWPRGFDFRHFQIAPQTPGIGGRAIVYDTTAAGAQLAGAVVDNMQIWGMGSSAIASVASNLNGPWSLKIRDSLLQGGISLTGCGDTCHIENNDITGNGVGIAATFAPGASAFTVKGNNITSRGGSLWLYGAIGAIIEDNEFEVSSFGYNGPTGALMCVQNSSMITADKNKINASTLCNAVRLTGSNAVRLTRSFLTAASPFCHISDQQPLTVNQWSDNEYLNGATNIANYTGLIGTSIS